MRVVIGGANNGKRQFVKKYLEGKIANVYTFEGELPNKLQFSTNDYVVIAGFEKVIFRQLDLNEDEISAELVKKLMEIDQLTNLICICTDIGRGIVPLQKEDRKLRDTCGRLYQQLFTQSPSVVRIWYGIPEILKGEEWLNGKK